MLYRHSAAGGLRRCRFRRRASVFVGSADKEGGAVMGGAYGCSHWGCFQGQMVGECGVGEGFSSQGVGRRQCAFVMMFLYPVTRVVISTLQDAEPSVVAGSGRRSLVRCAAAHITFEVESGITLFESCTGEQGGSDQQKANDGCFGHYRVSLCCRVDSALSVCE